MYHKQIAELTVRIIEVERPAKIILFGSYANGTALLRKMAERLRRTGPFIREILSTGQTVYERP
jgi:electron transfer flavoprotein alpha subunit